MRLLIPLRISGGPYHVVTTVYYHRFGRPRFQQDSLIYLNTHRMHTWLSCCCIPSRCTLATNSMWYQITKGSVLPCDRWRSVLILSEVSWQCTQYKNDLSRPPDNISWSNSTWFFVAVIFLRACKFLPTAPKAMQCIYANHIQSYAVIIVNLNFKVKWQSYQSISGV